MLELEEPLHPQDEEIGEIAATAGRPRVESRPRLRRARHALRALVLLCAGHPPRVSVFRYPTARAAVFCAALAIQVAYFAVTVRNDVSQLPSLRGIRWIQGTLKLLEHAVELLLFSSSPLLLLRKVRAAQCAGMIAH